MYLETKMAYKTIMEIPVPFLQRFSCIVDEMMFRFKDMSKTAVNIIKVGPQTYRFGTKQIQAQVNNGKLLVRVGGGFMEIDHFY